MDESRFDCVGCHEQWNALPHSLDAEAERDERDQTEKGGAMKEGPIMALVCTHCAHADVMFNKTVCLKTPRQIFSWPTTPEWCPLWPKKVPKYGKDET